MKVERHVNPPAEAFGGAPYGATKRVRGVRSRALEGEDRASGKKSPRDGPLPPSSVIGCWLGSACSPGRHHCLPPGLRPRRTRGLGPLHGDPPPIGVGGFRKYK